VRVYIVERHLQQYFSYIVAVSSTDKTYNNVSTIILTITLLTAKYSNFNDLFMSLLRLIHFSFGTVPTVWFLFCFHIMYATLVYLIYYIYLINYYL
jgi:hypothetical protein